jgi:hypothetical protein
MKRAAFPESTRVVKACLWKHSGDQEAVVLVEPTAGKAERLFRIARISVQDELQHQ